MSLIKIAFIAFFVATVCGFWGYYLWNGMAARVFKGLFAVAFTVSLALILAAVFTPGQSPNYSGVVPFGPSLGST